MANRAMHSTYMTDEAFPSASYTMRFSSLCVCPAKCPTRISWNSIDMVSYLRNNPSQLLPSLVVHVAEVSPFCPIWHASNCIRIRNHDTNGYVAKKYNLLFIFPRFLELSLDKCSFMCIGHISQRHPEINRVTPKNESDEDELSEDNEPLATCCSKR